MSQVPHGVPFIDRICFIKETGTVMLAPRLAAEQGQEKGRSTESEQVSNRFRDSAFHAQYDDHNIRVRKK